MRDAKLTAELKARALELGFDLAGVAAADDPALTVAVERYSRWLAQGHGATMDYLARHAETKAEPSKFLPGVKSVLCVGLLYGEEPPPEDVARARVSLYARGDDYHELMGARLRELARWSSERGAAARPFVDIEPVLERFWAWRAGLGWLGKNTLLINRGRGSLLFLGGLFVEAELEPDVPDTDHCGRCRRCIDACPTQAITDERSIASERCIAYHTVENKGEMPEEVMTRTGLWIAGCDICQTVCPWNEPITKGATFATSNPLFDADLRTLARWSASDYKERVRGTASTRLRYAMFLRNVTVAVANSGLGAEDRRACLEALGRSIEALPDNAAGKPGARKAWKWACQSA